MDAARRYSGPSGNLCGVGERWRAGIWPPVNQRPVDRIKPRGLEANDPAEAFWKNRIPQLHMNKDLSHLDGYTTICQDYPSSTWVRFSEYFGRTRKGALG